MCAQSRRHAIFLVFGLYPIRVLRARKDKDGDDDGPPSPSPSPHAMENPCTFAKITEKAVVVGRAPCRCTTSTSTTSAERLCILLYSLNLLYSLVFPSCLELRLYTQQYQTIPVKRTTKESRCVCVSVLAWIRRSGPMIHDTNAHGGYMSNHDETCLWCRPNSVRRGTKWCKVL